MHVLCYIMEQIIDDFCCHNLLLLNPFFIWTRPVSIFSINEIGSFKLWLVDYTISCQRWCPWELFCPQKLLRTGKWPTKLGNLRPRSSMHVISGSEVVHRRDGPNRDNSNICNQSDAHELVPSDYEIKHVHPYLWPLTYSVPLGANNYFRYKIQGHSNPWCREACFLENQKKNTFSSHHKLPVLLMFSLKWKLLCIIPSHFGQPIVHCY